jgi:hypothetical protein
MFMRRGVRLRVVTKFRVSQNSEIHARPRTWRQHHRPDAPLLDRRHRAAVPQNGQVEARDAGKLV